MQETKQFSMRRQPPVCLTIFYILLISELSQLCHGYCWQGGKNPSFTAKPIVTQISITSVQVSWKGIVNNKDCADTFRVKYWKKGRSATDYKMSEKVSTDIDGVVLDGIVPRVEYSFQAVAVESKGILGIDYNRSPIVKFATSRLETKRTKPKDESNLNIVSVKSREKGDKGGTDKIVTLSTQATLTNGNKDLKVLESKESGKIIQTQLNQKVTGNITIL